MTLQSNLARIRLERGFRTQGALAEESGVGLRSIAAYETGESQPTLEQLVKLADALKCGLDDLVGRETPLPRVVVNDVRYVPEPVGAPEVEANGAGSDPRDPAPATENTVVRFSGRAGRGEKEAHKPQSTRPRPDE